MYSWNLAGAHEHVHNGPNPIARAQELLSYLLWGFPSSLRVLLHVHVTKYILCSRDDFGTTINFSLLFSNQVTRALNKVLPTYCAGWASRVSNFILGPKQGQIQGCLMPSSCSGVCRNRGPQMWPHSNRIPCSRSPNPK